MTSIKNNLRIWDSIEHWEDGVYGNGIGLEEGEKWSKGWGNSAAQWKVMLLPRIEPQLGSGTILELAPGRGRWTRFLKDQCEELIIVDLSKNCIDYCKERFSKSTNITYIVNDGRTLSDVADASIDFLFSFDSMVHVDACDLESYISEIGRVLTDKGVAFIHHSNLGHYGGLVNSKMHLRAKDVSAGIVARFCEKQGMYTIHQECIPWSQDNLEEGVFLDCLSTFTKDVSQSTEKAPTENQEFLVEQLNAKKLAAVESLDM